MRHYKITSPPHYRDGRLYTEGEIVHLPDDVRGPRTSIEVDEKGRELPKPVEVKRPEVKGEQRGEQKGEPTRK